MAGEFDFDEVIAYTRTLEKADAEVVAKSKLAVTKTALDTVAGAQAIAPVDTGNLKNSIGADIDDDRLGFEAGPTASYGADVEYGTRPHIIRPNRINGVLHFTARDGAEVFATQVNHPGTAPQPYMRPAFERAVAAFDQAIDVIVRDAF